MKKFKILSITSLMLLFVNCDNAEEIKTEQCDCVKTFYRYYPAMGSGNSYVPAHYDLVSQQVGKFNCSDETSNYVAVDGNHYSHYKIECD